MNWNHCFLVFSYVLEEVLAYSNNLYLIVPRDDDGILDCGGEEERLANPVSQGFKKLKQEKEIESYYQTIRTTTESNEDPFFIYQSKKLAILLGSKKNDTEEDLNEPLPLAKVEPDSAENEDDLAHYPSGSVMRSELFQNKSGVHLPMPELMHRDHCFLKLTDDYMQTAVDAFAILLEGSVNDVMNLPPSYVLKSARTIAMMNIEREKLVATWAVVKGDQDTQEVSYQVLEMYRPLFKYLSGREIARLNLSDERILTYIGTHADLNRHQVGVTAAAYIHLNPFWKEAHYLNLMNNLLCGVPMTYIRKITEHDFLQLTQQVFYHIRACDPIQRRFYLTMMTKTQALGKSYSWTARDVSRLGLLLTEVKGSDLAAVNPEAMSGITSQVMLEIPERNLKYISELQLRYLGLKTLNIYARRYTRYREKNAYANTTGKLSASASGVLCIIHNTIILYIKHYVVRKINSIF